MTEIQKRFIWISWLAVLPFYLYFFIKQGIPVIQDQPVAFVSLLLLMIIASLFPIRLKHTNIVPLHGFAVAVFLQLGLIVEMFIMQLSIFTSLKSLQLSKKEQYRYPLNSLIFMATSVLAASVFYLFAGPTGLVTAEDLPVLFIPIFAYAFTHFITNNWVIYLLRKYLQKVKESRFFDKVLGWEALSTIIFVPVSITLIIVFQEIGFLAIILIGIPIVTLSLFLRLYNESELTNHSLKKITTFGYQINDTYSETKIYNLFTEAIINIFPVDGGFFYIVEDGKLKIIKVFHSKPESNIKVEEADKISKKTFSSERPNIYNKKQDWQEKDPDRKFHRGQSIVSAPFISNHEVVGVITLFSNHKKMYKKSHLMLLEIMVNYLTVAITNVRNYRKTKEENERCGLTKLYNYRYFENVLLSKYERPKPTDEYAIILIDLDYFKRVNDTYGHQSGNDVLCQVANLLSETVKGHGILARYGGEEFVILIEGGNTKFVEDIAEELRSEIESHLFVVSEDIKGSRENKTVRMTASIGVARKMESSESPMSVLRNADRTMYIGAKQQGRNKVSSYLEQGMRKTGN